MIQEFFDQTQVFFDNDIVGIVLKLIDIGVQENIDFIAAPCDLLFGWYEYACVAEMGAVVDSLANILVIYAGDTEEGN